MELPVIRVATDADIPSVIAILRASEMTLAPFVAFGSVPIDVMAISQQLFARDKYKDATVKPAVDRQELLVAEFGAEVGAVVYRFWDDQTFWPDRPVGEAIYLDRIEVVGLF